VNTHIERLAQILPNVAEV